MLLSSLQSVRGFFMVCCMDVTGFLLDFYFSFVDYRSPKSTLCLILQECGDFSCKNRVDFP